MLKKDTYFHFNGTANSGKGIYVGSITADDYYENSNIFQLIAEDSGKIEIQSFGTKNKGKRYIIQLEGNSPLRMTALTPSELAKIRVQNA